MPASATPSLVPPSGTGLPALRARIAAIGVDGRAQALRQAPRRAALGHAEADAALGGGLLPGGLHEIRPAGPGDAASATGFALACLARFAECGRMRRPWLWIRQDVAARETGEPYGPGLAAFGVDPGRLRLVAAADARDALRAAEEGLRCRALAAVLLEPWGDPRSLDLTALRRLVLAAEASGVPGLLLRSGGRDGAGGAVTRWRIAAAPSAGLAAAGSWPGLGRPAFEVLLERCRQPGGTGAGGCWTMEWDPDERLMREPAASGGAVVSPHRERADPARGAPRPQDARRAG